MAELEGMRVLVTGASSGIGRATAVALRAAGAAVAGVARRVDRLAELELAAVAHCDLLDPQSCDRCVHEVAAALGGIDALVSVAGLTKITPIDRATIDTWRTMLDTNLVGPALLTTAAMPFLLEERSAARAIYVSSDSARHPYPGMVLYAAAKAGLETFSVGLHHEERHIRSTHVTCGPTDDTEMMRDEDPELITHWLQRWMDEGYLRHATQKSAAVARVIVELLRTDDPPLQLDALELS